MPNRRAARSPTRPSITGWSFPCRSGDEPRPRSRVFVAGRNARHTRIEPLARIGEYTLRQRQLNSQAADSPRPALPLRTSRPPDPAGSRSPAEDEDWKLLARVGRGDQSALETLYRQHYNRLCRFVYRITSDAGGIDDIVNEVMLVVWQKAASVTPQARATTWILGIAYKKALKAVYRGARHDTSTGLDEEMLESIGEEDANLLRLESDQLARLALARLPPEQRAVMELVYEEGMGYGDIAVVLGCPENTVKTRVFHARRRLRTLWAELNGTPSSLRDAPEREIGNG
jgi:RNA polymerase sigma factor (sigma-70 family)